LHHVIPAQAGIQGRGTVMGPWIPAGGGYEAGLAAPAARSSRRDELEIIVEHALGAVSDLERELLVVELGDPFVPGHKIEAAGTVLLLALAGIEQILIKDDAQGDLRARARGKLGPG